MSQSNSSERLELARKERVEIEDVTLTEVHEVYDSHGWLVTWGHVGLYVRRNDAVRAPKVGDTLRIFGRGLGYPVRGIGLVEGGKLTALYRYSTQAEYEKEQADEREKETAAKRAKWEAEKEKTAATIAAMPEVFRTRFEFFMRRPDWGWEFGPYELFVCTEAVKFAKALETAERVLAFHKMNGEEQRRLVPELSDDHSGNTFTAACGIAATYLRRPEDVPLVHGALCPLVGCEAYGCWAADAAKENQS